MPTSGQISSSQAPTLSISSISCQMRQARRSAPAPTMRLTGVNLSLRLPFALLLTTGFTLPVRPTTAHSLPPRRENSFRVMTTAAQGFAAFAMFVMSLNKRTYSYHTNNAGLQMSCSALAWGRFEHVSEIRE